MKDKRVRKLLSLLIALAMTFACMPAMATGLIGSITGVKEGDDILSSDQGKVVMEEEEVPLSDTETDSVATDTPDATQTTDVAEQPDATDASIDVQPATTTEPGTTGTTYEIDESARELYLRLKDETPIQEGWQVEFVGDSTLMMLAMPDLVVWNIVPESGIMELKWSRDLSEFLPEGEGGLNFATSPDGNKVLLSTTDGAVYLVSAIETQQIAPEGSAATRLIWARDSLSYAYINESGINVTLSDGTTLLIDGDVTMPVNSDTEWLNPGETPAALQELLSSEEWDYAGTGENCVLFDSASDETSCAYLLDTETVVTYPEKIFSSMTIGISGACPLYDNNSERYRLYLTDGSYADIPMQEAINSGTMANPYGWLGNSICVLEQDFTSRSTFRLHAANTSTGITYTLLAPWEYAELVNGTAVE